MRAAVVAAAVAAAAAVPAGAAAHGRSAPVATNWSVVVNPLPARLAARPLDGDRTLWLRAPSTAVVRIPGALGEPMLRFDPSGVWVDRASPTAQSDRIILATTKRGWQRLSSGHAWHWHEHRLHALEPLGGGRWTIPLVIDGRRTTIAGTLVRHAPPALWPSLLGIGGLASLALWRRAPVRTLSVVALAAGWAVRVGRALYGRPGVAWSGYLDVAIACALALGVATLLARARHLDVLATAALAAAALAVAEALTLLPVLWHAIALNALRTGATRLLTVVALGAGAAAGAAAFRVLIRPDADA